METKTLEAILTIVMIATCIFAIGWWLRGNNKNKKDENSRQV